MSKKGHPLRGALATVGAFLVMLAALYFGLGQVDARNDQAEMTAIEEGVRRAAVLCYAVEGRYPTDAEELCRNYGLTYDRERYLITLDSFASNLFPDIHVLLIGGAEDE